MGARMRVVLLLPKLLLGAFALSLYQNLSTYKAHIIDTFEKQCRHSGWDY